MRSQKKALVKYGDQYSAFHLICVNAEIPTKTYAKLLRPTLAIFTRHPLAVEITYYYYIRIFNANMKYHVEIIVMITMIEKKKQQNVNMPASNICAVRRGRR